MSFFSKPKFGSPQASHKSMGERDTSEEIYSPATESVILSPDTTESYDVAIADNDWVRQDTQSYGMAQNSYSNL